MECEICGKAISDHPKRVKIDGSIMAVCDECAKFGRIQKEPPKPKFRKQNNKNKNTNKRQNRRNDEPQEELIENYNDIVRRKREAKNWTREQLGQKLNEKVSVINRIESGKMVPDTKLIKKLEKTLDIELLETYNTDDLKQYVGTSGSGVKLGSIVKIKRK
ncbi:MAG: multiprotein bridging factor aMBF1 [Methanobrevibacter sp.]|uniref:multiprotein bridging factor aMBF1 n=1 Tax=Methanobrevibacter sp. TaxID=66852 RepID=UPI0026DF0F34|nr:multiprotein bridging factor aMBF1 [Methanobrevibacter sp.]MDO5848371.1 multiprotein bridging factor aMBF1 [Methanobrevibacter sp.]